MVEMNRYKQEESIKNQFEERSTDEDTVFNYTPHTIVIYGPREVVLSRIPSSGSATVVEKFSDNGETISGVRVFKSHWGKVKGLPEQQEEVTLIVPTMVALALPERTDLVSPTKFLRNAEGNIKGCRAFKRV